MTATNNDVYRFATLDEYTAKQRLSIRLADLAFYCVINLIGLTIKIEPIGIEHFESIAAAGKIPIYTFWHDRILLGTYYWRRRGIVVITSRSFDGEYIARFIQRFGYGAIRGSSSRSGARALVAMIKAMRNGLPMAFTVDGPRGPQYEAKPGPVILAKKTGNPIMPFIVESRSYWSTKSWDKMQIPRPFTGARIFIGEPIYVPADADASQVQNKVQELQTSLDELVRRGAEWRLKG